MVVLILLRTFAAVYHCSLLRKTRWSAAETSIYGNSVYRALCL